MSRASNGPGEAGSLKLAMLCAKPMQMTSTAVFIFVIVEDNVQCVVFNGVSEVAWFSRRRYE